MKFTKGRRTGIRPAPVLRVCKLVGARQLADSGMGTSTGSLGAVGPIGTAPGSGVRISFPKGLLFSICLEEWARRNEGGQLCLGFPEGLVGPLWDALMNGVYR